MLKSCGLEKRTAREVTLKCLVPDPATRRFIERCFELADEYGWGASRIAKTLNADDTIPDELMVVHANTVERILKNKIYVAFP